VIRIDHLSDAEKRAYVIADNKIAQNAGWDRSLLAAEMAELADILPDEGMDLEVTGFGTAELDALAVDFGDVATGPTEDIPPPPVTPTSRSGDIWLAGNHRIICGDARDAAVFERLMDGASAEMIFTDPPYNVRITGHVGGRGRTKHREFAVGSGELSSQQFQSFLQQVLGLCARHSVCIDWRHLAHGPWHP
jgi:hypothetical protein